MKKIIAMVLSVMLLCAAIGVTAEGADKPQFATFGDAFAAAGENPLYGGSDEKMAVIVEQDGKYIRVVTELDEKAQALDEAALESDDIDTAYAEFEAYVKTLPVSYTEEFTVQPKEQAELDGLAGKTIAELEHYTKAAEALKQQEEQEAKEEKTKKTTTIIGVAVATAAAVAAVCLCIRQHNRMKRKKAKLRKMRKKMQAEAGGQ